MLWRPILVIGRQRCNAHDSVSAVRSRRFPLAMGRCATRRPTVCLRRGGLGLGIHGHLPCSPWRGPPNRIPCCWSHHKSTPSKNHLSKITLCRRAWPARLVRACVTRAPPQGERFVLLDRTTSPPRDLGAGVDQHDQLPTIDRDLNLVHLAALVGHLPLAGDLATALILGRGFLVSGIDEAGDFGSKHPALARARMALLNKASGRARSASQCIGQRIWAYGPLGTRPLAVARASFDTTPCALLGIEATRRMRARNH